MPNLVFGVAAALNAFIARNFAFEELLDTLGTHVGVAVARLARVACVGYCACLTVCLCAFVFFFGVWRGRWLARHSTIEEMGRPQRWTYEHGPREERAEWEGALAGSAQHHQDIGATSSHGPVSMGSESGGEEGGPLPQATYHCGVWYRSCPWLVGVQGRVMSAVEDGTPEGGSTAQAVKPVATCDARLWLIR